MAPSSTLRASACGMVVCFMAYSSFIDAASRLVSGLSR